MIDRLCELDSSPWEDYNFRTSDLELRRIQPRQLAKLLKQYGIQSKQVWLDGNNKQGYQRKDFDLPWQRYLPKKVHEEGGA